jgi:hypothetical protein
MADIYCYTIGQKIMGVFEEIVLSHHNGRNTIVAIKKCKYDHIRPFLNHVMSHGIVVLIVLFVLQ